MTRRAARRSLAVPAAIAALLLAGCSGSEGSADTTSPTVTICTPDGSAQADDELPNLSTIAPAVQALRAELGAEPEFFEINATARLVNLFVALNGGTMVQPWLYLDGALTSDTAQAASGGTFTADLIDFDADTVLEGVRTNVPDAVLETFYVHGDGQGNVQYGVLVSAQCGGGLDVSVSRTGTVLSVDPT
ncbi:MAG: hypothetical protein ACO3C1_09440 [Ilumatobacteraceae bacterium]